MKKQKESTETGFNKNGDYALHYVFYKKIDSVVWKHVTGYPYEVYSANNHKKRFNITLTITACMRTITVGFDLKGNRRYEEKISFDGFDISLGSLKIQALYELNRVRQRCIDRGYL